MSRTLPTGKIPPDVLSDIVFKYLGVENPRILVGPTIGEDAAVIQMDDRVVVAATDPITGAVENIGWFAVHINANDIAIMGAKPLFYLVSILLPDFADEDMIRTIMADTDRAAKYLGISILGGHTEVTPDINRPILAGFMIGETSIDKYVTSKGAHPGDKIILTKGAGIEGTSILATDRAEILRKFLSEETISNAQSLIEKISVVKDCLIAIDSGGVSAMHDPTEGGVAGGIHELADASNVGFIIDETKIPILEETELICKIFKIDPLRLIGSGSVLMTVDTAENAEKIVENLNKENIEAAIIGEIVEEGRKIKNKEGIIKTFKRLLQDDLWVALSKEIDYH